MAKILVVDDNDDIRAVVKRFLESDHNSIVMASSGKGGLFRYHEALREEDPFDLILLDVAMPDLDGFSVAENIRNVENNSPDVTTMPIVFITAHPEVVQGTTLLAKYKASYLQKPFSAEQLRDSIDMALAESSIEKVMEHGQN